jgi:hypothetical protein
MNEESEKPLIAKLAERSGLKGDSLAAACGWPKRNGPQPYLEGRPVTVTIAAKFARGLVGKGSPPITYDDIVETIADKTVLALLVAYRERSGAPTWAPQEETVNFLLEAVLPSLTASHFGEGDVQLLAHALAEGIQYFSESPSMEDNEGYRKGAVSVIARALRNYRPRLGRVA